MNGKMMNNKCDKKIEYKKKAKVIEID